MGVVRRVIAAFAISVFMVGLLTLAPMRIPAATLQQALDASADGFAWLEAMQNVDGSWGEASGQKMIFTAEIVQALWVHNRKGFSYQRGITWLENHPASSVDLATRRFRALARFDAQVGSEQSAILAGKTLVDPPIANLAGWGVQERDLADPLDTALVLIAFGEQDPNTFFAQHPDAVQAQISWMTPGTVWTIGKGPQAGLVFPGDVLTTVSVAEALRLCRSSSASVCASPSQAQAIGTLLGNAEVLLAFAQLSEPMTMALRARYFGRYRNQVFSPIFADGVIDGLVQAQNAANGSWSNDPLVTATALQALGGWLQLDGSGQENVVAIADARLRSAVNRSLGKPAMDAVTAAEVSKRLENLDAAYAPLDGLGVLGPAPNLRVIDISGNPCLMDDPNIDQVLHQLFPSLQTIIKRPVGDVNRDGMANSLDHWLIEKEVLGLSQLEGDSRRAADLNFDDRIDSRDLYWLGRTLLGKDVSALCPS